jgi:hypothetical protein
MASAQENATQRLAGESAPETKADGAQRFLEGAGIACQVSDPGMVSFLGMLLTELSTRRITRRLPMAGETSNVDSFSDALAFGLKMQCGP